MLVWLLFSQKGYCCLDEHATHNYYMVSFVERKLESAPFQKELNTFWHTYTEGKYDSYPTYHVSRLRAYIQHKKDAERISNVAEMKASLEN